MSMNECEIKIVVQPTGSPCYNFRPTDNQEPQKITVYILPISVEKDGKTTRIGYACNCGRFCKFPYCIYARGSRQPLQDEA
jgi:hypothetical protein